LNSGKTLAEVYRVLNNKGVYICISYGAPKKRIEYLEKVTLFYFSSIGKYSLLTKSTSQICSQKTYTSNRNKRTIITIFTSAKKE
jgi:ubiquinone/menaquinone biosynthesis C-methylase UbiE